MLKINTNKHHTEAMTDRREVGLKLEKAVNKAFEHYARLPEIVNQHLKKLVQIHASLEIPMKTLVDSFRPYAESLNTVAVEVAAQMAGMKVAREIQMSFATTITPVLENMKATNAVLRELSNGPPASLAGLAHYAESTLAPAIQTLREIEQLQKLAPGAFAAQMNTAFQSAQQLLASTNPDVHRMMAEVLESASRTKNIIMDVDRNEIVFENVRYATAEIAQETEMLLRESGALNESEMHVDRIGNLLVEVRKTENPLVGFLLKSVLLPLLISVIVSFLEPEIRALSDSMLKRPRKPMKSQTWIEKRADEVLLLKCCDYRYAMASELNVREGPSRKTRIVGKLYAGQIVIVVKKTKNWTLIETSSFDGEVIVRGWAYTRYLGRFK